MIRGKDLQFELFPETAGTGTAVKLHEEGIINYFDFEYGARANVSNPPRRIRSNGRLDIHGNHLGKPWIEYKALNVRMNGRTTNNLVLSIKVNDWKYDHRRGVTSLSLTGQATDIDKKEITWSLPQTSILNANYATDLNIEKKGVLATGYFSGTTGPLIQQNHLRWTQLKIVQLLNKAGGDDTELRKLLNALESAAQMAFLEHPLQRSWVGLPLPAADFVRAQNTLESANSGIYYLLKSIQSASGRKWRFDAAELTESAAWYQIRSIVPKSGRLDFRDDGRGAWVFNAAENSRYNSIRGSWKFPSRDSNVWNPAKFRGFAPEANQDWINNFKATFAGHQLKWGADNSRTVFKIWQQKLTGVKRFSISGNPEIRIFYQLDTPSEKEVTIYADGGDGPSVIEVKSWAGVNYLSEDYNLDTAIPALIRKFRDWDAKYGNIEFIFDDPNIQINWPSTRIRLNFTPFTNQNAVLIGVRWKADQRKPLHIRYDYVTTYKPPGRTRRALTLGGQPLTLDGEQLEDST